MKKYRKLFLFITILIASAYYATRLQKKQEKTLRLETYYRILMRWLTLEVEKKDITAFFKHYNFNSVGIYGIGLIGRQLYHKLEPAAVVDCVIDKNEFLYSQYKTQTIDTIQNINRLDAIIVTPIQNFNEIEKELRKVYSGPIISIEEIFAYFD